MELPVTEPYAIKHMGHDGYKPAIDYGWPTDEVLAGLRRDAAITMPALSPTDAKAIYAGVTSKWIAEGAA